MKDQKVWIRWTAGSLCLAGLMLVFLFQRVDIAGALDLASSNVYRFIINRTFRFIVNDSLAVGLIFALFGERKYVIFAIAVQLFGMVVFLIPYFILKLNFPSYNGPLISFLHRLVLNPTLVLLLIPAFYYQRTLEKRSRSGSDQR
jgi:exosortase F-associated protein